MVVTQDDANAIKNEIYDYFSSTFSTSIPRVGLSTLKCYEKKQKISLRVGETLDDYCISIGWQGEPPTNANLPETCTEISESFAPIRILYDGQVDIARAI